MKRYRIDSLIRGTALMIALSLLLLMTSCDKGLAAVTVRVQRYEGSVSLISDGKKSTLMDNMLLHSGDSIVTGQQSYIDMRLDDTKAVGLTQNSSADLIKSGKKLEVDVKKGELYFYTTKKLEKDETFNLRSETLIVGIRGTSGYLKVGADGHAMQFILTSGNVHVTGVNPTTGGRREAEIRAGQKINVYLFNDKEGADSVVFYLDDFDIDDLPLSLLSAIAEDENLLNDVSEQCGIPKEDILDALNRKKNDDGTDDDSGSTTTPTNPPTKKPDATTTTVKNASDNLDNTSSGADDPSDDGPITPIEDDTPTTPTEDDNPTTPTDDDNTSSGDDTPTTPTGDDNPTGDDTPTTPTGDDNPTGDDTPTTPTGDDNPTGDDTPTTPTGDDNPTGTIIPQGIVLPQGGNFLMRRYSFR